jgi:hypothetical protein
MERSRSHHAVATSALNLTPARHSGGQLQQGRDASFAVHGADSDLRRTEVDAGAGHDERPGLFLPEYLELRRHAGHRSCRDADDGGATTESVEQSSAEPRLFRSVEVDRLVDHDDVRFEGVLPKQLHKTGQPATIGFSTRWFIRMGDAGGKRSGRFGRIPFIESHGGGQGCVGEAVNANGDFHGHPGCFLGVCVSWPTSMPPSYFVAAACSVPSLNDGVAATGRVDASWSALQPARRREKPELVRTAQPWGIALQRWETGGADVVSIANWYYWSHSGFF